MPIKMRLHPIVAFIMLAALQIACSCYGITYSGNPFATSVTSDDAGDVILPPSLNCEDVYLTSPLGGLPNGVATFYWDPIPNADTIQINLYGENVSNASFSAPGTDTNLTADVSTNAIGGVYLLEVEIVATDDNGNACSKRYPMQREAPPPQDVPPPAPVSTPTCEENPYAPYC
jgi:hypothetical protein